MPRVRYAEPAYVVDQTADPGTQVARRFRGSSPIGPTPPRPSVPSPWRWQRAANWGRVYPSWSVCASPSTTSAAAAWPSATVCRRRRTHRGSRVPVGATRRGARPQRRRARRPSLRRPVRNEPPRDRRHRVRRLPRALRRWVHRRARPAMRELRGRGPARGHMGRDRRVARALPRHGQVTPWGTHAVVVG